MGTFQVAFASALAVTVLVLGGGTLHAAGRMGHIAITAADGSAIYVIAADGSGMRRMRPPAPIVSARVDFSSDAKALAMPTVDGIYVMSANGSSKRRIPNQPVAARAIPDWVSWSPEGAEGHIAFTLAGTLWTVFANGNALRRIASNADTPDWSPDGTQIAFVRDLSLSTGMGRIYAVGTDGRDLHFIVRGAQPAFSPDGERLAFAARNGIYVMSAEGGTATRLVANASHPVWSPDGKRIAFTRDTKCAHAGCVGRIFIVPASGGRPRAVGPTIFDVGPISWSR